MKVTCCGCAKSFEEDELVGTAQARVCHRCHSKAQWGDPNTGQEDHPQGNRTIGELNPSKASRHLRFGEYRPLVSSADGVFLLFAVVELEKSRLNQDLNFFQIELLFLADGALVGEESGQATPFILVDEVIDGSLTLK